MSSPASSTPQTVISWHEGEHLGESLIHLFFDDQPTLGLARTIMKGPNLWLGTRLGSWRVRSPALQEKGNPDNPKSPLGQPPSRDSPRAAGAHCSNK